MKIHILGYGSTLRIGAGFTIGSRCEISLGYNSYIEIGKNCTFGNHVLLSMGTCSQAKIGDHCIIREDSRIFSWSKLNIGKGTTFGRNLYIVAGIAAPILIGDDCLFSYYVKVHSDNGHSIFDLEKKKNMYMNQKNEIYLDRHVWVGMGVSILNHAKIGADSVIGAESLVKGNFPANVMLAGSLARIIKENISWDHKNNLSYEDWIKKME